MTPRYRIIPSRLSPTRAAAAADLAEHLDCVLTYLTDHLHDSEQQLARESGAGHAYYTGRVDAFRLAIDELRGVAR